MHHFNGGTMESVQLARSACGRRWSPGDRFRTKDNYIGTIISISRDKSIYPYMKEGNRHEFYVTVKWEDFDFGEHQPIDILTKAEKLN